MSPSRRIAFLTGVLFLITYITSIPALLLFQPVLDDPVGYVTGGGSDNRIIFGAFLELLLIIANIGSAVVLYPLLRRQNHILALGFVTARVMESVFIAVGILAVLTVVTLGQETPGAEAGTIAYALAALGLVGGPLLCASAIAVLFDVFDQGGTGQSIATIPEFIWELALGIWLTVKGFTPSPIAAADDRDVGHEAD